MEVVVELLISCPVADRGGTLEPAQRELELTQLRVGDVPRRGSGGHSLERRAQREQILDRSRVGLHDPRADLRNDLDQSLPFQPPERLRHGCSADAELRGEGIGRQCLAGVPTSAQDLPCEEAVGVFGAAQAALGHVQTIQSGGDGGVRLGVKGSAYSASVLPRQ